MDGYVPPAQKLHALSGHDDLQHFLRLGPLEPVLGEEEHARAVVPLPAQLEAQLPGGALEQLMRNLEQ